MKNVWQSLPRPFLCLAPMEDVTDTVFRQMVAKVAKPDIFFTEFTSTDGLCSVGRDRVGKRLLFTEKERPLIAQIWGNKPAHYLESAKLLVEMGFDGVDINMGCPIRTIVRDGACSGLIHNPPLAKEIIQATKEGAKDLPVSVKTRLGAKTPEIERWIGFLLDQNLAALTIHGRTVSELSLVPAHWDEIKKVVTLRDEKKLETLIIGNGDVKNYSDAREKAEVSGVDGVMIGRGIFHDLLAFDKDGRELGINERLQLLIDHVTLFEKTWEKGKPFEIMKKYIKIYTSGMPDAVEFRLSLMECQTASALIEIVTKRISVS